MSDVSAAWTPRICVYDVSASRGSRLADSVLRRSESESLAWDYNQRQYQGQGPRQEQQEYLQVQGNRQMGQMAEEYVFSGDSSFSLIL